MKTLLEFYLDNKEAINAVVSTCIIGLITRYLEKKNMAKKK